MVIDENTALLPETSDPSKSQVARIPKPSFLMKDPSFWLLAFFTLITLGASEMVISNIGTIVVALPSEDTLSILSSSTAQQVQLLSISNTAVRVITGFIADIISPAALPVNGTAVLRRKRFISRIVFLSWPSLFLALTFLLVPYIVKTQTTAWILSIGVGTSYGAIFAIMPSIVSAIWGMENLGRNFGILMTAPLVGTSLFSYLYAFVSESHTTADGVCAGRLCWLLTFQIGAAMSFISFALTVVLWFRWRGLL
jgi:MFS family permease